VEGTAVYEVRGEHIGSIERGMIYKRSGQVAYAVLRFDGFLGIGSDTIRCPGHHCNMIPTSAALAPIARSKSSGVRRNMRGMSGTGQIVSVPVSSTTITV
jgi:hypothetical protein